MTITDPCNHNHHHNNNHNEEEEERKLYNAFRKAAGSQSLDLLKAALRAVHNYYYNNNLLTATTTTTSTKDNSNNDNNDPWLDERILNQSRSESGKNALHMAAWQGCLENVKYLVQHYCYNNSNNQNNYIVHYNTNHINGIATGEYCFGKTPIFFACTRSREDIVHYLLDQGARVTIVNNKGQSVLSIASTHLSPATVERIRQLEIQQSQQQQLDDDDHDDSSSSWLNYRKSHSDGLEYGDLDLRFLDRPLRETDVVVGITVNPTTKQSRRGSFIKRNPQHHNNIQDKQQQQVTRKKNKNCPPSSILTVEEEEQLDAAWKNLEQVIVLQNERENNHSSSSSWMTHLFTIMDLNERRKCAWIPDCVERLGTIQRQQQYVTGMDLAHELHINSFNVSMRHRKLLAKIHACMNGTNNLDQSQCKEKKASVSSVSKRYKKTSKSPVVKTFQKLQQESNKQWQMAYQMVQHLSIRHFEINGGPVLSLPRPPTWIDTVTGLDQFAQHICNYDLIAIDTEWTTIRKNKKDITTSDDYDDIEDEDDDHTIIVSTLQVATVDYDHSCWVIDLLVENDAYQEKCRAIVWNMIMNNSKKAVLGFSLGNDLPKLLAWLHKGTFNIGSVIKNDSILVDVQRLWHASCRIGLVPSLVSCVECFSSIPLSKHEQCSDWSCRPLTAAQLHYAGLDAAILLALFAEKTRELLDSNEVVWSSYQMTMSIKPQSVS